MSSLELINIKVKSFIVFNKIFEDKVMKSFIDMIDVKESSTIEKIEKYSNFVGSFLKRMKAFLSIFGSLLYLMKISIFVDYLIRKLFLKMLEKCVKHELETLKEISMIIAKEIKEEVGCAIFLPE